MTEWINPGSLDFGAALISLSALVVFAVIGWLASIPLRNVSFVDSMWSLMFLLSLGIYMLASGSPGWRSWLIFALTALWSVRLSAYITVRNHGEGEDHRYQEIRANNSPNFQYKSLYIVFGLQALLAWIISFPLLAAASDSSAFGWLDIIGIGAFTIGFLFEAVGDAQLARFKSNPGNRGKVLDSGLWRYTRHPNYFGEFLLHWGFFLIAAAAGGAWTLFAPVLMSFLLLKVSGVSLLEKSIGDRRPGYKEYIERTNAFFPGRPKKIAENPALFIGLLIAVLVPLSVTDLHASSSEKEWNFEVFVNDKSVGNHRFSVRQDGDKRYVNSVADFEYKVLFLSLYRYQHSNNEVWNGTCLESIESATDANGKEYSVNGKRDPQGFLIDGKTENEPLSECVSTFAYWDNQFLNYDELLNAQTGDLVSVEVEQIATETLGVGGESLTTNRYRLDAGEVLIDLWYTPEGDWVGLETQPREGRVMRYVLQ